MKIAVLVSGGVDSSVALQLLKDQGHDLVAFYLKIWLEDEVSYMGSCPWQEDLSYVEQVCKQLDVPLQVIPLQKEYWERVVSYTLQEISQGHTPSPDILCNQQIKFGAFFEAIDASFDKVATGHYAQIIERDGYYLLAQAADKFKDQTYFLSQLSQQQLSRLLFPIGHLLKKEVRELAEQYNLPNKARKDSQGICFLGKIDFRDFIKHYQGVKLGDLIEYETQEVVGHHEGFWFYTIGQRKGIGLSGGPWYVVKKDVANNVVYISKQYHEPHLVRNQCVVSPCHWIAQKPTSTHFSCEVKLRHGETLCKADVVLQANNSYSVTLQDRDQGIAPGQFVVFYDNNICLGSGVIKEDNDEEEIQTTYPQRPLL